VERAARRCLWDQAKARSRFPWRGGPRWDPNCSPLGRPCAAGRRRGGLPCCSAGGSRWRRCWRLALALATSCACGPQTGGPGAALATNRLGAGEGEQRTGAVAESNRRSLAGGSPWPLPSSLVSVAAAAPPFATTSVLCQRRGGCAGGLALLWELSGRRPEGPRLKPVICLRTAFAGLAPRSRHAVLPLPAQAHPPPACCAWGASVGFGLNGLPAPRPSSSPAALLRSGPDCQRPLVWKPVPDPWRGRGQGGAPASCFTSSPAPICCSGRGVDWRISAASSCSPLLRLTPPRPPGCFADLAPFAGPIKHPVFSADPARCTDRLSLGPSAPGGWCSRNRQTWPKRRRRGAGLCSWNAQPQKGLLVLPPAPRVVMSSAPVRQLGLGRQDEGGPG